MLLIDDATRIKDLPRSVLSSRALHCLLNDGVETVGDARRRSDAQIAEIPNCGPTTQAEIRNLLRPMEGPKIRNIREQLESQKALLTDTRKKHLDALDAEATPIRERIRELKKQLEKMQCSPPEED